MITTLIEVTVASWALAAGAGLALALAKVRRADTRLFAWTCVLTVSAALPLLGGAVSLITWPSDAGTVAAVAAEGSRVLNTPVRFAASAVATRSDIPWFLLAYASVSAVLLLREGLGARLAAGLWSSAEPVEGEPFFESPRVRTPVTVGLVRPRIVLPLDWRSWSAEMLATVLTHEQGHVARRDGLRVAGARMFRAVCWMNPLAWWLPRHLTSLADQASDEYAIEQGIAAPDYAETLLRFAASPVSKQRIAWTLPMATGSRSRIEARIDHILCWKGTPPMSVFSKVTVAAVLIVSGAILQATPGHEVKQTAAQSPDRGLPLVYAGTVQDPVLITAFGERPDGQMCRSVAVLNQTDQAVRALTFTIALRQGTGSSMKRETVGTFRVEVDVPAQTLRTVQTWLAAPLPVPKLDPTLGGEPTLEWSIANVEYATADVQTTQGSRGAGPGQAGRAGAGQDQDRKEPVLLSMTHPKYTAEAMRQKIEGTVELELDIDADGVVTGARVVKSLDTMYGLDDQAIAAAMKTTFRPATENGLAVGTTVKFQMEFRLH